MRLSPNSRSPSSAKASGLLTYSQLELDGGHGDSGMEVDGHIVVASGDRPKTAGGG
jgi:hypothetical protein